jgi:hypothetical protein
MEAPPITATAFIVGNMGQLVFRSVNVDEGCSIFLVLSALPKLTVSCRMILKEVLLVPCEQVRSGPTIVEDARKTYGCPFSSSDFLVRMDPDTNGFACRGTPTTCGC